MMSAGLFLAAILSLQLHMQVTLGVLLWGLVSGSHFAVADYLLGTGGS